MGAMPSTFMVPPCQTTADGPLFALERDFGAFPLARPKTIPVLGTWKKGRSRNGTLRKSRQRNKFGS